MSSYPGRPFEESLWNVLWDENSCAIISEEHYSVLVCEVTEAKTASKKTSKHYRRLNRFDIEMIGAGVTKLIKPITPQTRTQVRVLLHITRITMKFLTFSIPVIRGPGMAEFTKWSTNFVASMPIFLGQLYITKSPHPKKGVVVHPIIFKEVNARAQVDLIDMQTCSDNGYNFILDYQDQYVSLRLLKRKTNVEVAYHMIDIFCIFGVPSV